MTEYKHSYYSFKKKKKEISKCLLIIHHQLKLKVKTKSKMYIMYFFFLSITKSANNPMFKSFGLSDIVGTSTGKTYTLKSVLC